ncbi:MAG: DUF2796 domain-containing protein [SAR324 cluster bacterium]|nr:DUF2796 domain-containing protein [SAR324 cluster bacterium]
MKYCFAYIFIFFTFLIECYAQSSLEAHIHGEAKLNIVFEGQELLIELQSPSYNLVGFEHEPKTKNQHELVNNTIELLRDFENIADISSQANCKTVDVSVSTSMRGIHKDEHHKDEHHKDEHHDSEKETHSEFTAIYSINCEKPEDFKSIELELFKTFSLMEEVKVQTIIQGKQSFGELISDNPKLSF